MKEIQKVGVIGTGQMGSGIAQVAAAAGFEVIARDLHQEQLSIGRKTIELSLAKFVEKGKLAADARDQALKRLRFTTELEDLAEDLAELVRPRPARGWCRRHYRPQ